MSSVLYGPIAPLFIREAVSAIREVNGLTFGVRPIIDMLILVSVGSKPFSESLLEEIMKQYKSVNSGELKNLSTLLLEVLVSISLNRIAFEDESTPMLIF